jgi:polar amino acid transport system substrate-binding protein
LRSRIFTNVLLGFAIFAGVLTSAIPFAHAQQVDDLILLTEQYPPYNFRLEGQLQGISVDLLELMLKRVDSNLKRDHIKLVPWSRGYRSALSKINTCLFSTTRTDDREKLFKWVGPIAVNRVVLIGKKEREIRIQSVAEIGQFSIGVVTDDVAVQFL